jgi:pimeloyl-ACP methyl ester carboxylesterase
MTEGSFSSMTLQDGRRLSFADYGDAKGKPVFFFHGFPGSRFDGEHAGQVAAEMGLRLVAPDRPGMGGSDYQPHRRLLDWPADVEQLADALGLTTFGVLGYSGGGPYALACAYRIPHRLTSAGVLSGVAPVTEPGAVDGMNSSNVRIFRLSRRLPWLLAVVYRLNSHVDGVKLMEAAMKRMPEPDQAVMRDREVLEAMAKDYKEAFRKGPAGVVHEGGLYAKDWGFRLADVSIPVALWHGEKDTNAPVQMGRYQASTIPTCHATFYPDDGHISIMTHHICDVLGALAEDGGRCAVGAAPRPAYGSA